jgi:quaternary ammonium compound-resistance protein SugE
MTAWLALALAGLFEIVAAYGLKHTHGFTRLWPSVGTLVAIGLSFALFAVSLRSVPLGTAYAVWAGIGAAGTVALGMLAFGEPADAARILCLILIVAGTIGLRLAAN